MTPLELVRSTSPPINGAGAAFYFDPATLARGKELGLDGFRFYVLGRGGVLGDVEPAVVASAFGYFAPGVMEAIWGSAKERIAPREAAREYLRCAEDFGRSRLSDLDGLDAFDDAAEAVVSAVDVSALALFAGVAAEPLPDDAPARAYRNVVALRELRGSVHLLAIVASGLHPATAHAIRRPDDVATFGWVPAPQVTDEDRAKLDAADELTDALLVPWYGVLTDEQVAALDAGTSSISAALT